MTLAELSVMLVWAAATSYTVALIAYAVDWSQLADRSTALRNARREALVAAGAGGGAAGAEAWAAGAPAAPVAEATTAGGRAAGIARSTAWLGLGLHLLAIALRGVAAGRAPWANMYEFTLVGAFCVMAVFLVVQARMRIQFAGPFATGVVVLAVIVAQRALYVEAEGVEPALQSYWLVLHVGVAIIATGIFTVACVISALQLLRDSRTQRLADPDAPTTGLGGRRWRTLDSLPGPARLEAASFRLNAVGFVLWTLTLIGGAVWAEDAWGRYWNWDPKEVWTFVVWVVYAAYLHARTTRGWSGRRAAWFVIVGYACVIFNFTAVNLIFDGLHSYAGLPTT